MMDATGQARLWNYQEGIMGLIIESITRMLRGEQGKAALAALASDLAANAARAGVERLAAARGEDNTLVRAGRKGQAGLETLAHTNHARLSSRARIPRAGGSATTCYRPATRWRGR